MMADARRGRFDVVLVWAFDRLARSVMHFLQVLDELNHLGIQFISYQKNIDTSTPLGQALFTIVAAVAQLERDLIRERVAAGIRVARQNGKRLGRPRVTVSMDEILRLRAEGQSSRKIAAALGIGEGTVRDRLNSQARKTSSVSGS